jgi:chromosome partitioning protein
MRTIAIVNNKGGIGKTTSAVNIAALLAENHKTLLIDIDGQSNATSGIGLNPYDMELSIYNVLCKGVSANTVLQKTAYHNLDVIPSNIKLTAGENELLGTTGGGIRKLKKSLSDLEDKYTFAIIDCPPSAGILTQNALLASSDIIIPMEPEPYALAGASILNKLIADIKEEMDHEINLLGVLITRVISTQVLHQNIIEEIKKYFGPKVFKTIIKKNIAISESAGEGKPISVYNPKSSGSQDYRDLVEKELLPLLVKKHG